MICSKCGEDKLEEEFYSAGRAKKPFSRGRQCKTCQRERIELYRINNREKILAKKRDHYYNNKEYYYDSWLKRKFGISREEYDKLSVLQKNKCAICGCEEARNLAVDHDHETGRIRGLLCTNCNTAIGSFKDDIVIMEQAIKYIKGEK